MGNNITQVQINDAIGSLQTVANHVSLQSAMYGLPTFDGDIVGLREFIFHIQKGRSFIKSDLEALYVARVMRHLRGRAFDSICGQNITTTNELIRHLENRFAPEHTYSYYAEKIENSCMLQHEKVGDFYDRINILLDGARNSLLQIDIDNFEHMMYPLLHRAVDIFIKGLPVDIARAVDAAKPTNLEAAYREAVRMEIRIGSNILPDIRCESHSLQCNDISLKQGFTKENLGNNILEITECSGRIPPIEITQHGQIFLIKAGVDTARCIDSSLLNNIFQKVKKCLMQRNIGGFKLSKNNPLVRCLPEKNLKKIINNVFKNSNIEVTLE